LKFPFQRRPATAFVPLKGWPIRCTVPRSTPNCFAIRYASRLKPFNPQYVRCAERHYPTYQPSRSLLEKKASRKSEPRASAKWPRSQTRSAIGCSSLEPQCFDSPQAVDSLTVQLAAVYSLGSSLNVFAFLRCSGRAVPMYRLKIEPAHKSHGSPPGRASMHNTKIGFFQHRRGACCTRARNISKACGHGESATTLPDISVPPADRPIA
jgi:hypothetical protein